MTLRAAIIGCGRIGSIADARAGFALGHAGGYRRADGVELTAACDPDPEQRRVMRERWGIERTYADWNTLFATECPDIVSLCVPTALHLPAFQDACRAGVKAILMEKPLAPTFEQACQMPSLAENRPVVVAFHRRWNSDFARLASEFRQGIHGKVLHVTVRYIKGLLVNGSHFIDLVTWMFGPPTFAKQLYRHEGGDAADPGYDFRLQFRDDFAATFLHVPKAPYLFFEIDILTDIGRVLICERGQQIKISRIASDSTYDDLSTLSVVREAQTDWRDWPTKAIGELVHCLTKNRKPSCGLEEGLNAAAVCHAVANNLEVIPYAL